ncbi:MAG: dihydrofolate reductase family protein, partial [Gemmatimonadales bacterium]
MRKVIHFVAMSLDGCIAGPKGEVDWLFMDQDYGMKEFFASVDTALIGRKTFEFMLGQGMSSYPGLTSYVFSRTLQPSDYPEVELVHDDAATTVDELRAREGKHIWLLGGGGLFRSLLDAGQVDELTVAVHPILLGRGIPVLPTRETAAR